MKPFFPFTSLNPNVGARLKAELQLLPDVLLNLSSNFGDALVHDQHLTSPGNTDTSSSSSISPAGKNLDPNGACSARKTTAHSRYRMCREAGAALIPELIQLTAPPNHWVQMGVQGKKKSRWFH